MRLWVLSYATILLLGSMYIIVLRKAREIIMRRLNFYDEKFQEVTVKGITCRFSDMRIDRVL